MFGCWDKRHIYGCRAVQVAVGLIKCTLISDWLLYGKRGIQNGLKIWCDRRGERP